MRTKFILGTDKERHGDLLDVGHLDEWHDLLTFEPVLSELLEAISETVHDPVLLRGDGLGRVACLTLIVAAQHARPDGADFLEILLPVRAIDRVDAILLELHDGMVGDSLKLGHAGYEAGSQLDDFVKVIRVKFRLEMGQTIVHLNCALRVAQIKDLILLSCLLDRRNIGCVIVEAHLTPRPVPILPIARCIERHVALTIHRATIVPDPHIVAGVDQQQME